MAKDIKPHYMKHEHRNRLCGAFNLRRSSLRPERPFDLCRSVLSEYPGDLLVMLEVARFPLADICHHQKRPDLMSEHCEQMLERYRALVDAGDPPLPEVGLSVGDLCRRIGRNDLASEAYRRVADQYFDTGFDARGIAVLRVVFSEVEDRPDVHLKMGLVLFRMGRPDEAMQSLTMANGGHEGIPDFDADPEVAIAGLRDAISHSGWTVWGKAALHLALAHFLKRKGEFDESLGSILTAGELLRAFGSSEIADLAQSLQPELESLLRASADPIAANVGQLRTLLVHSPDQWFLHLCLGFALKPAGALDEAVESLHTAERLLHESGNHEGAEIVRNKRREFESAREPCVDVGRVEIPDLDADPSVAIPELREALRHSPDCINLHLALGRFLWKTEEFEEALESYLTAEELCRARGDFERADKVQQLAAEMESLIQTKVEMKQRRKTRDGPSSEEFSGSELQAPGNDRPRVANPKSGSGQRPARRRIDLFDCDGRRRFGFDGRQLFIFPEGDPDARPKSYGPDGLVSVEIIDDQTTMIITDRASQIGGAIAGGLLLGVPGAIVGGLSGSKSASGKCDLLALKVVVDDPIDPTHVVPLLRRPFWKRTGWRRSGGRYRHFLKQAEQWHGRISMLIHRAAKPSGSDSEMPSGDAVATQLERLKKLHVEGDLTDAEYAAAKKKTLGS